jgi:hypothetical protein
MCQAGLTKAFGSDASGDDLPPRSRSWSDTKAAPGEHAAKDPPFEAVKELTQVMGKTHRLPQPPSRVDNSRPAQHPPAIRASSVVAQAKSAVASRSNASGSAAWASKPAETIGGNGASTMLPRPCASAAPIPGWNGHW